jgi:p25-alpha
MEGKTFAKMAKDFKLIDKKLTQADIDLIFAKVKVKKTDRKITFSEFVNAVELMAEKKGVPAEELAHYLVETN